MIPGTATRAAAALDDAARAFEACGWRRLAGAAEDQIVLTDGDLRIALRHAPQGRFLGGTWALEIATVGAVLPPSRGLRARGVGAVRMAGVRFRARRDDAAGQRLAERLSDDAGLSEALKAVDFESVRVEADGTPVIRHLGGSVVWVLLPPILRATPLVEDQARSAAAALRAFAARG
jgi:hypothetical protein